MRRDWRTLGMAAAIALLVGCTRSPTGPTPPGAQPPGPTADCHALNYPGTTGGERIQRAIDDQACTTVYISPLGPDAGVWQVGQTIRLRSNLTLTGESDRQPATLRATAATRVLSVDGQANVAIRRLALEGVHLAHTGLLIIGSTNVSFTQGSVAGMTQLGVMIRDRPSSDITIANSRFDDNGLVDVRTETASGSAYHAHVVVEGNTLLGTPYGVAMANCGGSEANRCLVRDNFIKPKRSDPGTGVDLNRSHAAIVSGNRIHSAGDICSSGAAVCECGRGLTVDDTDNATISGNLIDGCTAEGILLANGAVAANRPWSLTGNVVSGNTIQNNGTGLASFRVPVDTGDRNTANVFRSNTIIGNRVGCATNAEQQLFVGNGPQPCSAQTSLTH